MEVFEVLKPGTRVEVAERDGIIRQVCMGFAGTTYEVAWFSGGDRKTAWLSREEFAVADGEKAGIGFRDGPTILKIKE